ncbi:unnamed protein product [Effrenium voratum]|nr:unnamed protein product [Effrenium voratum]
MHYTTNSSSLFAGEQISRAFFFRVSAGKKEKTRGSLTGAEKDDLRRMERKLEKRLTTGYRASDASARERPRGGEGWGAGEGLAQGIDSTHVALGLTGWDIRALMILEMGFEIKQDQMGRMLAQCMQRPGIVQICMTIKLLQISPNAVIPVEHFLRGLGMLVQRRFPAQILRMWLNMGCPRDQRSLRPLPYDYDEDEKRMVGQDLEDALGVITDDEEDRRGADRKVILVQECKARPELNGKYERSSDLMANGRPVFEKKAEVRNRGKGKGKGKGKHDANEMKRLLMPHMLDDDDITIEVMVIHYKKDSRGINTGWWISKNTCTGPGMAWNGRDTKGPPTGGWFVIRDRQKLPDPVHIIDPKQASDESYIKKRKSEGSRALEQLDGNKLKGRLQVHDKNVMASEYFGHFCMLMHLEHMEELRQIRRRTETMQDGELQRLGWTLDGLPCIGIFGRRDPKKNTIIGWEDPGSEMGTLQLPPNTQFERLKFKRGDSVIISHPDCSPKWANEGCLAGESRQQVRVKGEALEKLGEGFIADIQLPRGRDGESKMIVRLRGCWPDDAMARRWRIDKGANSTLYERQLQAMLNLVNKDGTPRPELLISAKVGLADSWAKQWRKGQGVTEEDKELAAKAAEQAEKDMVREKEAAKLARLNPGGADSDKLDHALKEVKTLTHLNTSQRDAVHLGLHRWLWACWSERRSALRTTCTVIQGPPGTGKTHVSVQIMKMWSKTLDLSPLLATSDSGLVQKQVVGDAARNPAVDNIAIGLRKEGVRAVRVGRPDKINRILEEITLECLLDKEKEEMKNRQYEARWKSKSRSKSGSPKRTKVDHRSRWHRVVEVGADKRMVYGSGKGRGKGKGNVKNDFELQMRILQDADVICTTTISSGGDFFSKFAFAGVLIDEAAQATELAAIVPLILRGSQRLVLVGDQCQLPPTVQSTEAEERGLSLSLYSRTFGQEVGKSLYGCMVDSGGLMPFLLDTQYRSHPVIAEFSARTFYAGKLKSGIKNDDRKQVRGLPWPNHVSPIAFLESNGQEEEEGESKFNPTEAELVQRLVQDAFFQRELEITEIGVVTPYVAQVRLLKRMCKQVIPEGMDPDLLEIASVDQFQGREKDLIIFSAVRCNRVGNVGFLADWRRLNVMLTRARRGMVVVGNSHTLKADEHWEKWLQFYEKVASGRARSPSPNKKKQEIPINETEEEKEARLKKERIEAARKLSMAIRFPGLAMAQQKKKEERERSPSWSPDGSGLVGQADTKFKASGAQGGRTRARVKTPSPVRQTKVVKAIERTVELACGNRDVKIFQTITFKHGASNQETEVPRQRLSNSRAGLRDEPRSMRRRARQGEITRLGSASKEPELQGNVAGCPQLVTAGPGLGGGGCLRLLTLGYKPASQALYEGPSIGLRRRMVKRRDEEEMDILPKVMGKEEEDDVELGIAEEPKYSVLGAAVMLAGMFFRDPARGRRALGLSISVGILLLLEIGAVLYYSDVQKNYMTALQEKNIEAFYHGLWMVAAVIVFISPIICLHEYTSGCLKMSFRESLTKRFAGTYLAAPGYSEGNPFYRLTLTGEIDNPDQRICQDVHEFVGIAVNLVQDVVRTFLNILGFAAVLYKISRAACFGVLAYSVTGTLIATRVFGPWLGFYQLQRVKQEAGLRYDLIRVRENAESVAFFEGGTAEWSKFNGLFNNLLGTVYRSIMVTSGFGMFNRSFHWATFAIPALLVGPAYLRGEVPFGVISQASMAFNIILGALTLVMDRLESLTDVAVRIRRLEDMELSLRRCKKEAQALRRPGLAGTYSIASSEMEEGPALLRFAEVTLRTPPRAELQQQTLCRQLSVELVSGQSLLIVGESGIGKSSLLRAAAGLWADGSGMIQLCRRQQVFFMPQKPYMFLGTLQDQLLYPNVEDSLLGNPDIRAALQQVNLHQLLDHHGLSESKEWSSLLSLGQQQRINFARILLRPELRMALIDEGTSACDPQNEALLYKLLQQRLEGYVSVGHRPALQQFHSHVLYMHKPEGGETQFDFLPMAEFQRQNPSLAYHA